jgi:hypothetical protein
MTQHCGRLLSTHASYLGDLVFESPLGDQISWLKFQMVLLSPFMEIPG